MDIEDLWINAKWTLRAREILNSIEKFPVNSKIILILRHSHRNEPKVDEVMSKLRLTEIGHAVAKRFGEALPINRSVRLFHSVVWRCQETAEDILEGFRKKSGKGEINGILKPLFFAGTPPNFFVNTLKEITPIAFIYHWAAGHFAPERIMPFTQYCKTAAKIIWNELNSAPEKSIDIHITHDIFLTALRFGWFGLPPKKEWVPFLGGFAFNIHDNKITLFDNNQFIEKYIPYWWKDLNK